MLNSYRLLLTLLLFCLPTLSAFGANISITANCPLYQSKNKQTNPDNRQAIVGSRYAVKQTLGPQEAPTWVRVDTKQQPHPLRWIAANCTDIAGNTSISAVKTNNNAAQCQIAKQYDSHVLALSWQPGFCQTRGSQRTECQQSNNQQLSAKQFSLHGLWPNRQGCGISYGYCGEVTKQPAQFCNYPKIDLSQHTREQLHQIMPSAAYGTCLQRHEWWKHGTCRDSSAQQYYQLAIELTQQVNQSTLVQEFVQANRGKTVSRSQFNQALDTSFGQGSYRHVSLQCRQGQLVEILLQLPKQLSGGAISQLLRQGSHARKGSCGHGFMLSQYP